MNKIPLQATRGDKSVVEGHQESFPPTIPQEQSSTLVFAPRGGLLGTPFPHENSLKTRIPAHQATTSLSSRNLSTEKPLAHVVQGMTRTVAGSTPSPVTLAGRAPSPLQFVFTLVISHNWPHKHAMTLPSNHRLEHGRRKLARAITCILRGSDTPMKPLAVSR